jgi:hypothetical protein
MEKKEVKITRLTSGEELIAETTSDTAHSYLSNVYVIIPSTQGVQIYPYMPYADFEILMINDKDRMWQVKPHAELLNIYKEQTGQQPLLEVPSQNIIV